VAKIVASSSKRIADRLRRLRKISTLDTPERYVETFGTARAVDLCGGPKNDIPGPPAGETYSSLLIQFFSKQFGLK